MSFKRRTTREIYDAIAQQLSTQSELQELQPNVDNSQQLLNDLTTTIKVASWRLFGFAIAFVISTFEANIDSFIQLIERRILDTRIGNIFWLIDISKKFQLDDTIVINEDTGEVGYEVIDESKQIIKYANVEEISQGVILKVRKESGALSVDETSKFQTYINKRKAAGSRIFVRSVDSDKLDLYMNIVYRAEKALDTIKEEVYGVINEYIEELEFNSKFKVISLIDKLQELDYIVDVQFEKGIGKPITGNDLEFQFDYNAFSGWMEIDTALDDTITFESKNTY